MLVFEGTLPIVPLFGSKLRNEFEYTGQPSKLVHLFPAETAVSVFDAIKNDFA